MPLTDRAYITGNVLHLSCLMSEIYLPKETKDLYIENYKTLVKEIKRTLIDGEIYCVHGSEESI